MNWLFKKKRNSTDIRQGSINKSVNSQSRKEPEYFYLESGNKTQASAVGVTKPSSSTHSGNERETKLVLAKPTHVGGIDDLEVASETATVSATTQASTSSLSVSSSKSDGEVHENSELPRNPVSVETTNSESKPLSTVTHPLSDSTTKHPEAVSGSRIDSAINGEQVNSSSDHSAKPNKAEWAGKKRRTTCRCRCGKSHRFHSKEGSKQIEDGDESVDDIIEICYHLSEGGNEIQLRDDLRSEDSQEDFSCDEISNGSIDIINDVTHSAVRDKCTSNRPPSSYVSASFDEERKDDTFADPVSNQLCIGETSNEDEKEVIRNECARNKPSWESLYMNVGIRNAKNNDVVVNLVGDLSCVNDNITEEKKDDMAAHDNSGGKPVWPNGKPSWTRKNKPPLPCGGRPSSIRASSATAEPIDIPTSEAKCSQVEVADNAHSSGLLGTTDKPSWAARRPSWASGKPSLVVASEGEASNEVTSPTMRKPLNEEEAEQVISNIAAWKTIGGYNKPSGSGSMQFCANEPPVAKAPSIEHKGTAEKPDTEPKICETAKPSAKDNRTNQSVVLPAWVGSNNLSHIVRNPPSSRNEVSANYVGHSAPTTERNEEESSSAQDSDKTRQVVVIPAWAGSNGLSNVMRNPPPSGNRVSTEDVVHSTPKERSEEESIFTKDNNKTTKSVVMPVWVRSNSLTNAIQNPPTSGNRRSGGDIVHSASSERSCEESRSANDKNKAKRSVTIPPWVGSNNSLSNVIRNLPPSETRESGDGIVGTTPAGKADEESSSTRDNKTAKQSVVTPAWVGSNSLSNVIRDLSNGNRKSGGDVAHSAPTQTTNEESSSIRDIVSGSKPLRESGQQFRNIQSLDGKTTWIAKDHNARESAVCPLQVDSRHEEKGLDTALASEKNSTEDISNSESAKDGTTTGSLNHTDPSHDALGNESNGSSDHSVALGQVLNRGRSLVNTIGHKKRPNRHVRTPSWALRNPLIAVDSETTNHEWIESCKDTGTKGQARTPPLPRRNPKQTVNTTTIALEIETSNETPKESIGSPVCRTAGHKRTPSWAWRDSDPKQSGNTTTIALEIETSNQTPKESLGSPVGRTALHKRTPSWALKDSDPKQTGNTSTIALDIETGSETPKESLGSPVCRTAGHKRTPSWALRDSDIKQTGNTTMVALNIETSNETPKESLGSPVCRTTGHKRTPSWALRDSDRTSESLSDISLFKASGNTRMPSWALRNSTQHCSTSNVVELASLDIEKTSDGLREICTDVPTRPAGHKRTPSWVVNNPTVPANSIKALTGSEAANESSTEIHCDTSSRQVGFTKASSFVVKSPTWAGSNALISEQIKLESKTTNNTESESGSDEKMVGRDTALSPRPSGAIHKPAWACSVERNPALPTNDAAQTVDEERNEKVDGGGQEPASTQSVGRSKRVKPSLCAESNPLWSVNTKNVQYSSGTRQENNGGASSDIIQHESTSNMKVNAALAAENKHPSAIIVSGRPITEIASTFENVSETPRPVSHKSKSWSSNRTTRKNVNAAWMSSKIAETSGNQLDTEEIGESSEEPGPDCEIVNSGQKPIWASGQRTLNRIVGGNQSVSEEISESSEETEPDSEAANSGQKPIWASGQRTLNKYKSPGKATRLSRNTKPGNDEQRNGKLYSLEKKLDVATNEALHKGDPTNKDVVHDSTAKSADGSLADESPQHGMGPGHAYNQKRQSLRNVAGEKTKSTWSSKRPSWACAEHVRIDCETIEEEGMGAACEASRALHENVSPTKRVGTLGKSRWIESNKKDSKDGNATCTKDGEGADGGEKFKGVSENNCVTSQAGKVDPPIGSERAGSKPSWAMRATNKNVVCILKEETQKSGETKSEPTEEGAASDDIETCRQWCSKKAKVSDGKTTRLNGQTVPIDCEKDCEKSKETSGDGTGTKQVGGAPVNKLSTESVKPSWAERKPVWVTMGKKGLSSIEIGQNQDDEASCKPTQECTRNEKIVVVNQPKLADWKPSLPRNNSARPF